MNSYAISPAAPAGVSFSRESGLLTGTPTAVAGPTVYTITATTDTGSVTATFTLTVLAGTATTLKLVTAPDGAINAQVMTTQPVVRITDAYENTVTSFTGDVTASVHTGPGVLSGPTTVAAVAGVASFTGLAITANTSLSATANNQFSLTFTAAVLPPVTSNSVVLTVPTPVTPAPVTSGAATAAAITTQPTGAASGSALGTQPVIRIVDASGTTVTSASPNVVASIASGPGAGRLSGTTTVNARSGVATFTNLVITGPEGSYTVTFTPTALTAVTSSSLTITAGAATAAAITTQPTGAASGSVLGTQPVIRIVDASGSTVTSSSVNVVASIASGTGTLSGTTTVAASAGVATFTNLVITGTAGSFTLTFTPTALTAVTSSSLTITAVVYALGATGPGGGGVYYYNAAGFNCGPAHTDTCYYLEVAPKTWNALGDYAVKWGQSGSDIADVPTESPANNSITSLGRGYKNSLAIIAATTDGQPTAASVARAYTSSKSDWYLPSAGEFNELWKWANSNVAQPGLGTIGVVGTLNSLANGFSATYDLKPQAYWSSSEVSINHGLVQATTTALQTTDNKASRYYIRPVRAF